MKVTTLGFAAIALLLAGTSAPRAEAINAVFDCDNGTTLNVVFDNDQEPHVAIVTIEGKEPLTLPIAESGSGYAYTNGKYTLTGKGEEAEWGVGRMKPTPCQQLRG